MSTKGYTQPYPQVHENAQGIEGGLSHAKGNGSSIAIVGCRPRQLETVISPLGSGSGTVDDAEPSLMSPPMKTLVSDKSVGVRLPPLGSGLIFCRVGF
jgi:hypothetical protein